MGRIPIACTLTAEQGEDRIGEPRTVLAARTDLVERRVAVPADAAPVLPGLVALAG